MKSSKIYFCVEYDTQNDMNTIFKFRHLRQSCSELHQKLKTTTSPEPRLCILERKNGKNYRNIRVILCIEIASKFVLQNLARLK